MTRSVRLAHRTGHPAVVVPVRAVAATDGSTQAPASRSVDPRRPLRLESTARQAGLDRSSQLERTRPLPARPPQDGAPAAVATTGTGHRTPNDEHGLLRLRVVITGDLDRSWDRARLTGARA